MTRFTFLSFLDNWLKGKRWDAFHSPYLFRLFSFMSDDRSRSERFSAIEAVREKWLRTKGTIERSDFGSGSVYSRKQNEENISSIARHALSLPFQCRCMARLVQSENPGIILELGTSLGISTAYLHAGNPFTIITTIEGDPEISKLARSTFDQLHLNGILLITSTFEDYLLASQHDESKIDLLFLDGNHRATATLDYFENLKKRFTPNTIIIVDDIYWSKDMYQGWQKLIAMPEVTQSVDCFQFGILFFRNEFLNKENHVLRTPMKSLFKR